MEKVKHTFQNKHKKITDKSVKKVTYMERFRINDWEWIVLREWEHVM